MSETFGSYTVSHEVEERRFFVKATVKNDKGEEETKSLPIKRWKSLLILTHTCGDKVVFSTYKHAGKVRFRDSRYKAGEPTPTHAIAEVRRMLQVDEAKARELLRVGGMGVLAVINDLRKKSKAA